MITLDCTPCTVLGKHQKINYKTNNPIGKPNTIDRTPGTAVHNLAAPAEAGMIDIDYTEVAVSPDSALVKV